MINLTLLGERIRELRKAKNVSQDELASYIHMRRQAIALIEAGKSNPSIKTLDRIANALGLTLDQLVRFDE